MTDFKIGKINKQIMHSDILNRDVTLSIYLPQCYSDLFKSRVIICFDGLDFFRFGRIQKVYETLQQQGEVDRAIIVGFHYEDVEKRREEFHPQGERAHLTVKAIAKELLPFIERQFPTYKVGNSRLLIGDSLAASIALLTSLTYPTIFSQVALLSPHHDHVVKDKLEVCNSRQQLTI